MSKSVPVLETGQVAGGAGCSREPDGKAVLDTAVPPHGKTFSLFSRTRNTYLALERGGWKKDEF